MKFTTHRAKAGLAALAVSAALFPFGATAQNGGPTTEQLLSLIQAQQKQLDEMKAALKKAQAKAEKADTTARDAKQAAPKSLLPDYLSIGGLVEVEGTSIEAFNRSNSSDITLAKVEAFIEARPSEYVKVRRLHGAPEAVPHCTDRKRPRQRQCRSVPPGP
jgi:hypothetical protein